VIYRISLSTSERLSAAESVLFLSSFFRCLVQPIIGRLSTDRFKMCFVLPFPHPHIHSIVPRWWWWRMSVQVCALSLWGFEPLVPASAFTNNWTDVTQQLSEGWLGNKNILCFSSILVLSSSTLSRNLVTQLQGKGRQESLVFIAMSIWVICTLYHRHLLTLSSSASLLIFVYFIHKLICFIFQHISLFLFSILLHAWIRLFNL